MPKDERVSELCDLFVVATTTYLRPHVLKGAREGGGDHEAETLPSRACQNKEWLHLSSRRSFHQFHVATSDGTYDELRISARTRLLQATEMTHKLGVVGKTTTDLSPDRRRPEEPPLIAHEFSSSAAGEKRQ